MELTQSNTISSLMTMLFRVLCEDIKNFFSSVHFILQNFWKFFPTKWDLLRITKPSHIEQQHSCNESRIPETSNIEKFHTTELNMVMSRLGIECAEDEGDMSNFRVDEFSALFDEEPSLQEIKETFDVFDIKKDGFIDASELQCVLCSIGLKEGYCKLEECRRMIRAFDDDDNGLIDLNEFVKFMEKCCC